MFGAALIGIVNADQRSAAFFHSIHGFSSKKCRIQRFPDIFNFRRILDAFEWTVFLLQLSISAIS